MGELGNKKGAAMTFLQQLEMGFKWKSSSWREGGVNFELLLDIDLYANAL